MYKLLVSTAAVLLLAASVLACNVPVFRYALDHWSADSYRVVVLHKGPLSPAAGQAMDQLNACVESKQCNLVIHSIDTTSTLSQADQAYVDTCKIEVDTEPTLLLHYPAALDIREPVLTSPLEGTRVSTLVDSPMRRELLQRLAHGQSAVWMLVKSGDESLDRATEQIVEKELRQLQATLELPKLTDDPADAVVGGPELRVEFSLLSLDRNRSAEHELVQMLVNSEVDLKELDQPILFAAFGRGRVLWPLVGPGITAENIREMAVFVTGACSCQVKEQNPGFDLLLKTNWDELLPWTTTITTSGLVDNNATPELVPIPNGNGQAEAVSSPKEPMPVVKVISTSSKELVTGRNWTRILVVVCLAIAVPLVLRRLWTDVRAGGR